MRRNFSLYVAVLLFLFVLVIAVAKPIQQVIAESNGRSWRAGPTPTPPPVLPIGSWITPRELEIARPTASDGAELVYVPGGEFIMGSALKDPQAYPDEYPQHRVHLDGFWIHKNEVTNEFYARCVEDGPCTAPEPVLEDGFQNPYFTPTAGNLPVVGVTWAQAATYCEWANGRLPTEAEWEKAARGTEGFKYPWGSDDPNCDLSNLEGCKEGPDIVGRRPQGESPPEALDMAGNVREWVYDYYLESFYDQSPTHNPYGPETGFYKVVRGGGWQDDARGVRAAIRYPTNPDTAASDIGFRCVILGELNNPPMCQLSYQPLCGPSSPGNIGYQPGRPTFNQPYQPVNPDNVRLQFSCTSNGATNLELTLRRQASPNDLVLVNGRSYECETSEAYPDRLFCSGPAARQGQTASITICGENGQDLPCPEGTYYDTSQETCLPFDGGGSAGQNNCPAGTYFDTTTGDCMSYGDNGTCPTGYYYDSELERCFPYQPGGNEGECSSGYVFDAATETCQPDPNSGGRCPLGYVFDASSEQCQPTTGESCPLGYVFDSATEECLPSSGGECPPGYYLDPQTEECASTTGGSCPYGFVFDAYTEQCVPTTYTANCPSGSYFNDSLNCCTSYSENGGCPVGYSYDVELGYCQPRPSNGECPEGYYYDTGLDECRVSDSAAAECPVGYFYSQELESCLPSLVMGSVPTGMSAQCPEGSRLDQYSGACTPLNTAGEDCPFGYYFDPESEQCLSNGDSCPVGTYFDELTEQCVPTSGGGSGCPTGFYYDGWYGCCSPQNDGGREGCPEGYYYDSGLGYCAPTPQDGECSEGYYYDTELNRCLSNGDGDGTQCPAGEVFNTGLGYCTPIPRGEGECAEGYYYSAAYNTCIPNSDDTPGSGDSCPEGYYFDTSAETCLPASTAGESCVTINWVVAACPTPTPLACEPGYVYSFGAQKCVEKPEVEEPSTTLSCSDYTDQASCLDAGCSWDVNACYP